MTLSATADTHTQPHAARTSRRAASVMFLIDGVGFGVWAALLPSLQHRLAIGDGELSAILFAMVTGAVVAMGFAGRVIARFGSRVMLRWVAPAFCVALCIPAIAPNFLTVTIAATLFGALKGPFDVAINAQAITVEKALGRPVMSSLQALWSFGGLGAAGLVGLALKADIAPLHITLAIAVGLLLLATWFSPGLLDNVDHDSTPGSSERSGGLARLWPLGVLAFITLFAEGVMMDWSAIYTHRVAGAETWLAPFAYGVFCTAMGVGRLLGDRLLTRFSTHAVLKFSGWLATFGLAIVVAIPHWPATFCGLVAVGFGLSNLVPIFLVSAGRVQPGAVAQAVATISMIGYAGFLAGPPIVGMLSNAIGLSAAFGAVALLMVAIGLAGPVLLRGAPEKQRIASPILSAKALEDR